MTDTPPEQKQASYTAQETPDTVGLGRTAGQRTAEIFAGLRAEMMPSPETVALSRLSGRIIARLLMRMGKPELFNFVSVRLGGFKGLVEQEFSGKDSSDGVIVEIGSGFSPRSLQLARDLPNVQVIEIDLPDVIEEKYKRLSRVAGLELPSNLTSRTADLGVTPLTEVLKGQKVDVVSAEGLLPYFTFEEITRIAREIRDSLKPGGVFIADLGYITPQGAQQAGSVVSLFRRQTRTSPGSVQDKETAIKLFKDAGYSEVKLYHMPEVAEMFDLPRPAPDVLFFMVAKEQG